jgi:hypothetical protein
MNWLDNPNRVKRLKDEDKPESFGTVLNNQKKMNYGREVRDEDIPF